MMDCMVHIQEGEKMIGVWENSNFLEKKWRSGGWEREEGRKGGGS